MKPYPAPTKEGWYWAKLVHPSQMPSGEDWASRDWEVVEVWDNNGEGDETYAVHVTGIGPPQWIPDFIWGPEVIKPKELRE
jgi:hypothetical protein